jgi:hypothetical protein
MEAFKCDKCGKYFDHQGNYDGARLTGSGYLDNLKPGWFPNRLDICPDCAKSFRDILKAWWNMPDTKGGG